MFLVKDVILTPESDILRFSKKKFHMEFLKKRNPTQKKNTSKIFSPPPILPGGRPN